MRVAAAFALGLLGGGISLALARPILRSPVLRRTNFRGAEVATAGGLVALIGLLLGQAAWSVAEAIGDERVIDGSAEGRVLATLGFAGFALLGLVDDLLGSGEDGRGFRGHLRALARGRLTTGGVKLVGGLALALVLCAPRQPDGLRELLLDAPLVALAANLGNLLDRAPGRTIKAGLVFWAVLIAMSSVDTALLGVSMAAGAVAALLVADVRERLMLGDTGANALGAVLGLGVVLTASIGWRAVVLLLLVVLNVASEAVSYSRVIERVPPLRWIDRVGRSGS